MTSRIRQRNGAATLLALCAALALAVAAMTGCAKTQTPDEAAANAKTMGAPPKAGEAFFHPKALPQGPKIPEGVNTNAVSEAPSATEATTVPMQERKGEAAAAVIPRASLNTFLKNGPRHPLKLIQVQPAFQGGRFVGYKVRGFSDQAAGFGSVLRKGDVITRVNNRSLARPEDYMAAWESLKNCVEVRVQLVRDGKKMDLSWSVE